MAKILTMKALNIYLIIGLIFSFYLTSCESEKNETPNDPVFSIEFSDDTSINENDIAFYDSSTCILFLSKELEFIYGTEDPPYSFAEFSVFVNHDKIYKGIVYPSTHFNGCPNLYIYSKTYPTFKSDIFPIIGSVLSKDTLNDYRIIESLEKSNLLHHGINCSIDSIKISSDNDSTLICSIRFLNNDNVNYYIPDPEKMDIMDFNVIANISLTNQETGEHFHVKGNYDNFYWDISIDDLSILKSKDELNYTYITTFSTVTIKEGLYDCYLGVLTSIRALGITLNIPLNQENGRIWIGYAASRNNNIFIK